MTLQIGLFKFMQEKKLGDFYWAYSDILRGVGINESMYDQRIMAFMALKLLVDNEIVYFNFNYQDKINPFGLKSEAKKYIAKNTKATFLNIIKDIENLGKPTFEQDERLNPNTESSKLLHYINHKTTFPFFDAIEDINSKVSIRLDMK